MFWTNSPSRLLGAAALIAVLLAPPLAAEERGRDERDGKPDRRWHERGDRHRRPSVSPEQAQKILEYLSQRRPDMADRLRELRERDPEGFKRFISNPFLLRRMREYQEDPVGTELGDRLGEMRRQIYEAARRMRELPPEQVREAMAPLRELLTREHDLRIQLREHKLKLMEAKITEMRRELQEQRDGKERYIAEAIKKLSEGRDDRRHEHRSGNPSDKRP